MRSNCIQSVHRVNVPVVLIVDPAYPLRPWPMEPYINSGSLTSEQLSMLVFVEQELLWSIHMGG